MIKTFLLVSFIKDKHCFFVTNKRYNYVCVGYFVLQRKNNNANKCACAKFDILRMRQCLLWCVCVELALLRMRQMLNLCACALAQHHRGSSTSNILRQMAAIVYVLPKREKMNFSR